MVEIIHASYYYRVVKFKIYERSEEETHVNYAGLCHKEATEQVHSIEQDLLS